MKIISCHIYSNFFIFKATLFEHSSFLSGDKLLLLGGYVLTTSFSDKVFSFNVKSGTLESMNINLQISSHAGVRMNDNTIFLLGGTTNTRSFTNFVYRLSKINKNLQEFLFLNNFFF